MIFKDFPEASQFDIVLADPPWSYYGEKDKWAAAAKFYACLSDEEIKSLPVPNILSGRGILFLWTTSAKLYSAMDIIHHWGLVFRGVAFVWVKTKKDGTPYKGVGVRPSITKPITEYVLSASRVSKGRPLKLFDESIAQTIFAPRSDHSTKPDEVQKRIDLMYPDNSKIELFARRQYPGWKAWGDEVKQ